MYYEYSGEKYQIDVVKIYIELTTACNAKCPYCYNSAGGKGYSINKDALLNFLKREISLGVTTVHLSGGEPLLYSGYMELVAELNKENAHVLTVSNAFLITEQFLDSYMPKNKLQLTLDSMDESEHDRTRGIGNFRKVMDVLEYCREKGYSENIVLRHNVIRGNKKDLREFVEYAISQKIKQVTLTVLQNMGNAKNNKELVYDNRDNLQELLQINDEMSKLRQEYSEYVKISSNQFENQGSCPFNRPQDISMSPRVDYAGNVYICEMFDGEENIVGNILENSFEEIFGSEGFRNYMQKLFERQKNNAKCKKCLFNNLCTGGCPATQYAEVGSFMHCASQCILIKECFKNSLLERNNL